MKHFVEKMSAEILLTNALQNLFWERSVEDILRGNFFNFFYFSGNVLWGILYTTIIPKYNNF